MMIALLVAGIAILLWAVLPALLGAARKWLARGRRRRPFDDFS